MFKTLMKTQVMVSVYSRSKKTRFPTKAKVIGNIEYLSDGYILSFCESDDGCETVITARDEEISLYHQGMPSALMFKKDRRYECMLFSNDIPVKLNIRTKSLHNTVKGLCGSLSVKYTVEALGKTVDECDVSYNITPAVMPS